MNGCGKPEFWTSIAASGNGESNWLNFTDVLGQGANMKDFFNPMLNFHIENNAMSATHSCCFYAEEEMIVEVRGNKL